MSRLAHLAPSLALAVVGVVGFVQTPAHAAIPSGFVGTVTIECMTPYPRLLISTTNGSSSDVNYDTSYTVTHTDNSVDVGGGGGFSAPGGAGSTSIGLTPGDVVTASIKVGSDIVASITDVTAPNCMVEGTEASIEIVCNGSTPELVIDISNNYESKYEPTYGLNYSIWDGTSMTVGASSPIVHSQAPYHNAIVLQPGDEVSADISALSQTLVMITDEIAPDCTSGAGSGGGIPETGSTPAPLALSAAGLLGLGMLLTLTVRRRRTA